MGNCLKRSTTDDISLLRGNDSVRESSSDQLGPPNYQEPLPVQAASPVYHPSPSVTRSVAQLTEEEQVKIAKRIGLIQHLPTGIYDGCKKARECVICMGEFMAILPWSSQLKLLDVLPTMAVCTSVARLRLSLPSAKLLAVIVLKTMAEQPGQGV